MVVGALVLGAVVETIAVAVLVRHARFMRRALQVEGTVVAHRSQSSGGGRSRAPVMSYEVDGVAHRFESGVFGSGCPDIGATVTLHVDPDDPSHAIWESGVALAARVMLAVGLLMLAFGAFGQLVEGPVSR